MTGVIIRQTGDLRRIVDEFSKFARMPEPERNSEDLTQLLRDAVLLQKTGRPDIKLISELPDAELPALIDATMITQALTNLIKNAGEAIDSLIEDAAPKGLKPQVRVTLRSDDSHAHITIADNGIGLPEDRARLFEPYVTTRSEGTGLGLPIVKKIIEEHGGSLILTDAPVFDGQDHFGAMAVINLPLRTDQNGHTKEHPHE
jgi:two-component system nitrogen regulation sensor histidine kinase NtrY